MAKSYAVGFEAAELVDGLSEDKPVANGVQLRTVLELNDPRRRTP